MSKPVKEMIIEEYRRRFDGVNGGVLVHIRGMDAIANNEFRNELRKKAIKVTLLKNTLAKKAFAGTPLEALEPSLTGPSAFVYGAESPVDVEGCIMNPGNPARGAEPDVGVDIEFVVSVAVDIPDLLQVHTEVV